MILDYPDIKSILNDARKHGVSADMESLGFNRGQPMYSFSYQPWGQSKPTTHFFDVGKHLNNASQFGKDAYTLLNKENPNREFSSYNQFGNNFLKEIKERKFIVGHNFGFDASFLYESLDKTQREELQLLVSGTNDTRLGKLAERKDAGELLNAAEEIELSSAKYNKGQINFGGGFTGAKLRDASIDIKDAVHHPDGFVPAYNEFKRVASESKRAGRAVLVDTHTLTKLFTGLAADVGLMGNRRAIGGKLELLSEALGLDTTLAHGEADTGFNQVLLDAYAQGDIDKMHDHAAKINNDAVHGRFTQGELSDSGQKILEAMKLVNGEVEGKRAFVPKPGVLYDDLEGFNFQKGVGDLFIDYSRNGKAIIKTKNGREPVYAKTKKDLFSHISTRYKKSNKEIEQSWKYYEARFSNQDWSAAERSLNEESGSVIKSIKSSIRDHVKPGELRHSFSNAEFPSESISEAFKSKTAKQIAMFTMGAVALSTAISTFSGGYAPPENNRISAKDDTYNTIEGLHPGGGVNKRHIQSMTDFGSGYKGLSGNVVAGLAGMGLGLIKGYSSEEDLSSSLRDVAIGSIDDIALLSINAYLKGAESPNKYIREAKSIIESKPVSYSMNAFLGYSIGKPVGSFIHHIVGSAKIPSKDDFYNTIEALHPGGGVNKQNIQGMTSFGSGYDSSKDPHPNLSPSYNEAKDVYKYEWFRASSIGLSEGEIYKQMTQDTWHPSKYVNASANAGTALHEYMGALDVAQGSAVDLEKLVLDYKHKMSGHIDIIRNGRGVGDYKTVSHGIFNAIKKEGKAKNKHKSQVMYYLGQSGYKNGFVQYIDRSNIKRQMIYDVKFDPNEYNRLVSKVERVRAKVLSDIASGKLNRSSLPMTAGPSRLIKDNEERMPLANQAKELDKRRQMFNDEMRYLKTIKRGMPHGGAAAYRINNRHKKKNKKYLESTQGIGLEIYNHRNNHHLM